MATSFESLFGHSQNSPNAYSGPLSEGAYGDFIRSLNQVQQMNTNNPYVNNQGMFEQPEQDKGLFERDLNMWDQSAVEAEKATEWLTKQNLFGGLGYEFNPEKGFTPENIVGFAGNLPFQLASMPTDTYSHLYEGFTGRPVLERDDFGRNYAIETGKLVGEDLDPLQRAGDIGYSAINVGGLFAGASGRLLGAAGEAATKGISRAKGLQPTDILNPVNIGSRMAGNMAEGMFKRAGLGGKAAPLAQGVYDITEEAGEEFAQSYLEDTRYKQLDEGSLGRALEAGKWGALGGGLMSVGGATVHHFTKDNNSLSEEGADPDHPSPQNVDSTYQPYQNMRDESTGSKLYSRTMTEEYKGDVSKKSVIEQPGSVTVRHTVGNGIIRPDDHKLGDEYVRAVWEQGEDSRNTLLNWFNQNGQVVDQNQLENIIYSNNAAAGLNRLRQQAFGDGDAKVIIGRNPDTKNGGYWSNLSEFVHGTGLHLNPHSYMMVGADVDGDTSGYYFGTEEVRNMSDAALQNKLNPINVPGWVSQMYGHRESPTITEDQGRSNVEYSFGAFGRQGFDGINGNLETIVHEIFDGYTRRFGDNNEAPGKYFYDQLREAIDSDSSNRDALISGTIHNMAAAVRDMNQSGDYNTAEAPSSDRDVANRLFTETINDPDEYIRNAADHHMNSFLKAVSNNAQIENETVLWKPGSTGSAASPVQVARFLGAMYSPEVVKGNPTYRQYAMIGYRYVKEYGAVDSSVDVLSRGMGREDVFQIFTRESYRVVQAGIDPVSAIEGFVDGIIAAETLDEAGVSPKSQKSVVSYSQLELIVDTFREKRNEWTEAYNEGIKVLTDMGYRVPPTKVTRSIFKKEDENQAPFFNAFRKTFGSMDASIFFPIRDLNSENQGLTLEQLVEKYGEDKVAYREIFGMMDDHGFQKFFNSLINTKTIESNIYETQAREVLQSLNNDMTGIQQRFDGDHYAPGDSLALLEVLDVLHNLVHVKAAKKLGFRTIGDLERPLGRLLFGDEAKVDTQMSTIVGMNYMGKFIDALEWFDAHPDIKENEIPDTVNARLDDLARVDIIHARVVADLRQGTGRSATLDRLIDLSEGYDSKAAWMKDEFGDDPNLNLFASAATEANPDPTSSSLGQRLTVAISDASRYKRLLMDDAYANISSIRSLVNNYPNVDFSQWLNGQIITQSYEANIDNAGMAIYGSARWVNAGAEKGTSPISGVHSVADMDYMVNGGPISYLDELTNLNMNMCTLDMFTSNRRLFLSIVGDPDASMVVFDPETMQSRDVTRKFLFESAGITLNDNQNPTTDQWLSFFEAYPQVVSWLSTARTQASDIGAASTDKHAQSRSLSEEFQEYARATISDNPAKQELVDLQVRKAKAELGNFLLNKTWYRPYILRCISDPRDKEAIQRSPEAAQKCFRREHNKFVNAHYSLLLRMKEGTLSNKDKQLLDPVSNIINDYQDKVFNSNINKVVQSLNTAFDIDMMTASGQQATIVSQLTSNYAMKLFATSLLSNIGTINVGQVSVDLSKATVTPGSLDSIIDKAFVDSIIGNTNEYIDNLLTIAVAAQKTYGLTLTGVSSLSESEIQSFVDQYLVLLKSENAYINATDNVKKRLEEETETAVRNRISNLRMTLLEDYVNNLGKLINDFDVNIDTVNIATLPNSGDVAAFTNWLIAVGQKLQIDDWYVNPRTGEVSKGMSDLIKAFNDASDNLEKRNALIVKINQKIFRRQLDAINFRFRPDINSNMLGAMTSDMASFRDITLEAFDYMDKTPNAFGSVGMLYTDAIGLRGQERLSGDAFRLPQPKYDDQDIELIANNLINLMQSGSNPTDVGVNGSETKHEMGFGFLPSSIYGNIPPVQVRAGDIVDNPSLYPDNTRIVAPGKNWDPNNPSKDDTSTIRAQHSWLVANRDAVIQVFDPADNPHGLSDLHTTAANSDFLTNYHRLPGILGEVIDNSQEGMVMKRKKKFADKADIVGNKWGKKSVGKRPITVQDRETMLQNYKQFIEDWTDSIYNDNPVWTEQLKFGRDQARILAQGLTIGYEVRIRDNNGDIQQIILDANALFSDEMFENAIQAYSQIGEIQSAKLYTVPPRMMSYRAMDAVSRAARDGDRSSTVNQAALDAMMDWSDFMPNTLSAERIMSQIRPAGYFHAGSLVADDSRTPMQPVLDKLYGYDRAKNNNFTVHSSRVWNKLSKEDSQLEATAKTLRNELFSRGNPNDRIFLRVFVNDERTYEGRYIDKAVVDEINALSDTGYIKSVDPRTNKTNGAALLLDLGKFNEAVEWGLSTSQTIWMPKEFLKYSSDAALWQTNNGREATISLPLTYDNVTIRHELIDVVEVNPRYASFVRQNNYNDPEASASMMDRSQWSGCLMDKDDDFHLGDAAVIGKSDILKNKLIPERKTTTIDLLQFFPKTKETIRILNYSEVAALNTDSFNYGYGVKNWLKHTQKFDQVTLDRKIRQYVDRVINTGTTDIRNSWHSADVVGIAAIGSGDNMEIAPLLLPDTAANNVEHIFPEKTGSTYIIGWDAMPVVGSLNNASYAKVSLSNEAFKGIITASDNVPVEVDMVANTETEGSRVEGRDKLLLAGTLFAYTKRHGGHLLYEYKHGKWQWREGIPVEYRNATYYNLKSSNNIFYQIQNGSLDSKVADAIFNFSSDRTKLLLDLQSIIKICDRYKINPMHFFGASSLTLPVKDKADIGNEGAHLSDQQWDCNWSAVTYDMSKDQILRVFHAINPGLCPDGLYDNHSNHNALIFDENGMMKVKINGQVKRCIVRWADHKILNDVSEAEGTGGISSVSPQHMYRRGLDNGYLTGDYQKSLDFANFLLGNYEFIEARNKFFARDEDQHKLDFANLSGKEAAISKEALYTQSYLEIKSREEMRTLLSDSLGRRRIVRDGDDVITDPMTDPRIRNALDYLYNAKTPSGIKLFKKRLTEDALFQLINLQDGFSWGNGENTDLYITTMEQHIKAIARNIDQHGVPIWNENGYKTDSGRIAMPLLPRELADYVWTNMSDEIKQSKFNDPDNFSSFRDKMYEGMNEAENLIVGAIPGRLRSKKVALRKLAVALDEQWGRDNGVGYLYAGIYADELITSDGRIGHALQDMEGFDKEAYDKLCVEAKRKLTDMVKSAEDYSRRYTMDDPSMLGDERSQPRIRDGKVVNDILNNATELTKMMAVMNPGVFAGNVIDKGAHTTMMEAGLWFGHKLHLGPYAGKHWLNQRIVNRAANDETFLKLFSIYRIAGISGEERLFLSQANSIEEINKWASEREARMTGFQKAAAKTIELASGGNWMIKGQIRNFINRFVMFAEATPGNEFWFADVPVGTATDENGVSTTETMMMIEAKLANDPAGWFVDLLGGNEGMSASLTPALQAMNWAKQGDMSQRHVAAEIVGELCRRSPLGKFLFISTISKFPQYSFNVTHRMLNWVLPASSMYRVFTEYATMIDEARAAKTGKTPMHLEDTQIHVNLREAMLVDMTHLGVGAVAAILIAVSGMLEPPDDDDKWGQPEEWTVMGYRVGEAWWMQDILGMALPLSVFVKSAQEGKPNINTLINGMTQVCYSNPVVKVSDAVGFIFDPSEALFTDYQEDVNTFKHSRDGAPSYMDYIQNNAMSFGLNWGAQFFTPSILKELYNNNQQFEKTYKRIYTESGSGALTESGIYGSTMYTTYSDAMIRRATRRNPALGMLFNLVTQPKTGYLAGQMPDALYYDDAQLAQSEYWSIDGLSEEETREKLLQIICELEKYDDMDELYKTGFYLDANTRAALSEYIWDVYYSIEEQFKELGNNGQLTYTSLGEGDYNLGKERYYDLRNSVDELKSYLKSFYNDKIKYSYISKPMQSYRRYNTTYRQDDTGEIYATGFRPQGVLPFISAPGTLENPEITAGYDNDWVTVSPVTGQPIEDKRALVPWDEPYEEWPDLEAWAKDKNGNGYSNGGAAYYNNNGNSSYSTAGYRYASGGGAGRYYSRGGGGGKSGTPNIYSHVDDPNMTAPRTMNSSRNGDVQFDYLRPDFVTKGSREAYRRSDI